MNTQTGPKKMLWRSVVVACGTAAVVAGAVVADTRETSKDSRRTPVVDVFEASRGAVVNISSKEIITVQDRFGFGDLFEQFFDMPRPPSMGPREPGGPGGRQYTRTSVGSGFVLHPEGYIITNAHVVAQTAERKVIFADGREYEAQVVASDPTRDLAVLKVESDQPLQTLRLGRSDDLMIGETVIAIGNPLGYQNTVTAGVISAIDRELAFRRGMKLSGLIQTDASINPGNSGGPLLNVLGELIGVNTAIRGDAQNIGFAIPVDQLREVLPDLLDIERRYRVIAGLKVDTLNSPRVLAVEPGSPADDAGIRPGDELVSIDGRRVREGIDFCIALIGCRPQQVIDLQLQRSGNRIDAKLTLKARPRPNGAQLAMEKLGLDVQELQPEVAEALGLPGVSGLLVAGVEPGSPAERTGFQRRDVLIGIGRHSVASLDDLGQLLEVVRSGETLPITVLRIDRRMKVRMSGELTAR